MLSRFDLSLLPLDFSLILTVASRLLYPYSTNDKTSRLMVKSFSTVRDTHRGSQSYMEKRRRRREIDETKWRKWRVKRGREQSSQYSYSQVKMGTKDWFLKGTKWITNTKKQRLKI